jgi:hypothetical protein
MVVDRHGEKGLRGGSDHPLISAARPERMGRPRDDPQGRSAPHAVCT